MKILMYIQNIHVMSEIMSEIKCQLKTASKYKSFSKCLQYFLFFFHNFKISYNEINLDQLRT